jgi:uracil-DNA glycosylase family 4
MSRFHAALDLVLHELDGRRASGREGWRASAASLGRLLAARPGAVPAANVESAATATPAGSDTSADPPPSMPKRKAPDTIPPDTIPLFVEPPPSAVAGKKARAASDAEPKSFQPVTDPALPKAERLAKLRACPERLPCPKCPYGPGTHTHIVFGVGNVDAEVMFVGEAPGAEEDARGEPFVGRAGQLLNKIINTMGFQRADIYVANILKCRPDTPGQTSGNRPPTPAEMESCRPCLYEQVDIIQPKVIVALGATAMRGLLDSVEPMRDLRGRWHDFRGTPVMATYHPSYLLRNQSPTEKRKVWEDMLLVKERLGQEITARDRSYFLTKG